MYTRPSGEPDRRRRTRVLCVLTAAITVIITGGVDVGEAGAVDNPPIYDEPGEPPEDPPPPEPPVRAPALFEWSMPSRFGGDGNGDGLTDYFTSSDFCAQDDATTCATYPATEQDPLAPTSWHVDLDACNSTYGDPPGATFSWEILSGAGQISGGPGCNAFDLTVPAEGKYTVKLTVSSTAGTASVTTDVIVQDWLIVSLGDSYGSGEGNPDDPALHDSFGFISRGARWQDRRCHRSADAGSARAAKWLEQADPHTSVTFIHVACSGAEAVKGLLEAYDGVNTTWEAEHMDPLAPQLTQARELVGNREVDAVYVSIGGNDSNFAHIVSSCIALQPCNPRYSDWIDAVWPDFGMVATVCGAIGAVIPQPAGAIAAVLCGSVLTWFLATFAEQTAEDWFIEGLRGDAADGDRENYRLTTIYDQLADRLTATSTGPDGEPYFGLPASQMDRVFISEYVDATQDDEGDYCPKGDPFKLLNDFRVPGLGHDEYEWLDLEVERELNATIAFNAQRNGWNLVDGIHARYATHGLCADNSYLRGLLIETFWLQDDLNGAAHPNLAGHGVYRDRILTKLLPSLYPGSQFLDVRRLSDVAGWISTHAPRLPEQVPVADAGGPYNVTEGSTVQAVNGSVDDGPLTSAWSSSNPGIATVAPASAATPTVTGIDDGQATLTLGVSDDADTDTEASDTTTVTVTNVAPTVASGLSGAITLDEGGTLSQTATYSDPGTLDTHTAAVTFGDGGSAAPAASGGNVVISHTYADDEAGQGDDVYTVGVAVTDDDQGQGSASFPVTVNNVAPTVADIVAPAVPVGIGATVTVSSSYTDPGADDHTITWSWGDGSSTPQSRGVDADGAISATHAYTTPGVYEVTLTVDDHDGGVTTKVFQYIVAYDPSGGFAMGVGVMTSPAGALASDPAATGPARIAFVSKQARGASVPVGTTQFSFRTGDFDLQSTSYGWLVVSGGRAQFKGEANVNGDGGYGFLLSAVDGDKLGAGQLDRLRLKVWSLADGSIVYDNQLGAAENATPTTALTTGQITINNAK